MKKQEKLPVYGRGRPPFRKKDDTVYPAADSDLKTDILIIGGGLSGLLCAYGLLKKGRSAIIAERGGIGGGSTAFAPPYLLPDADVTMSGLTSSFGHDKALTAFNELKSTVELLAEITDTVSDRCGFTKRDSLLFAENEAEAEHIAEEYRLRKFSGIHCERLTEEECADSFSFRCVSALYEKDAAAEISPPLLCEATAAYLSVMGIRIYEDSPVKELIRTSDGFRAITGDNGHEITAKSVVDCRGLGLNGSHIAVKNVYAAVSPPQKDFFGWKNRCLVRNMKHNPLICCTTEDDRIFMEGYPGKRLLGAAEAEYAFKRLELTAEDMFFGTEGGDPSMFYERTFTASRDGLPYMGQSVKDPDLWQIFPTGRCGLSSALLASVLVSSALTGDKNALARLHEYEPF